MKHASIYLTICALLTMPGILAAQDTEAAPVFPQGTPILRIFSNVHYGLTDADPSKAFEVRRAYIGFKYKFDQNFSSELKLDIGSPEEISEFAQLRRYAYFKTAALYWDKDRWTIRAGIIDTEHYRRQEKYWKHRYIYKSMQDEHSFGPKADLGTTVIFRALEQLEIDASLMNGEGYTNLQSDNTFKTSLGINYFPISRVLLRVYYDFVDLNVWQSTFSSFAAYRHEKITAGAEFNWKGNRDFKQDHNQVGLSAYLSYDINDKFEVFGRYDRLSSNNPPGASEPWNLQDDGSAIISGIQYMPIKHVKIALNYQDWVPYSSNLGNARYIFVNLEIVL
ncbi:porin [Bacteroidota bacterium]